MVDRALSTTTAAGAGRAGTFESLDALVEAVADADGRDAVLYVRYSLGPDRDRREASIDYESGVVLPGLCVARLTPEPWWSRPAVDWVARRVCSYVHLAERDRERQAWVLAGTEVGRGPDHEPLVRDVAPLGAISDVAIAQARWHYESVFDAGRSSVDP